ncbi:MULTISPECIES: DUF2975 domain-containing protein [Bacillus]|uniref:DUF2975 domain-containing protein n=1 Tax=Bacillus TaxID=1386 RepID=UPI0019121F86|nr:MULTISPECIES: DUF2975 domain-containing protein [unclassified Bacillus (in: firmicutes)]MBK5348569.1 DUF2975 domain-containing protein [Bacillus sp. TH45]MBK5361858.1 DUF2975 domain-containing protein [Bacillus sp. TH44]MBK5364530.1 DUF2975 domain-containing protein [Bacillus sp. TH50]
MKQNELSLWLKLIIILCGCFGLLFCIYIGPETGRAVLLVSENLKGLYKPFVLFIWITGIPFFSALFLGWKICSDIASHKAFTVKNANRLKRISILSMTEGVLYIGALLYIFAAGSYHTSILVILLLIVFFSVVISIFTSLLSHLIRGASEIKDDNDLTI